VATSQITHWAKALEKHTRLANEAKEKLTAVLAQFGLTLPADAAPTEAPARGAPGRMFGGRHGSPRSAQILEVLKNSGAPMTPPQIAKAAGLPHSAARRGVTNALSRLTRTKEVIRLKRGLYALKGAAGAKAAPRGREADVLSLLKRHRILTAELLMREWGINRGNADQTLLSLTRPAPTRAAVLVRVGPGKYAAADSPAALMAGLKEAIKPVAAPKRRRPRKRAKPVLPEISAPPKPDPSA
jgi:hypothetical protein